MMQSAAAKGSGGGGRLWRYNYKVLLGTGYWILVLPVALSQVVTIWMMVLAADFSQEEAARIAELMTPLLGAFLAAHSLAPEYRSGVGAVLASKPLSLHRVLTVRVTLSLVAGLMLTAISLGICTTLGTPISVAPLLLASLPGLWFLSLVALTFATLFRNALGGFAVAAGIWALDYAIGYSVHPLLSLQGYTASLAKELLAELWVWNKAALIIGGALLLLVHGRLLPRICRPAQRADLARVVVVTSVVVLLYAFSGAAVMISYAYVHRGNLPHPDVVWLRAQLRPYGAIPIARVFGPAFAEYVAEPVLTPGTSAAGARLRTLRAALARYPHSLWADSLAFAQAWEEQKLDPAAAAVSYLAVADRFGDSPLAPKALTSIIRLKAPSGSGAAAGQAKSMDVPDAQRLLAARRLISDYPRAPEAEKAASYLLELSGTVVKPPEMAAAAAVAAECAPEQYQPGWRAIYAKQLLLLGQPEKARETAERAKHQALELQAVVASNSTRGQDLRQFLSRISHGLVMAEEVLAATKGP